MSRTEQTNSNKVPSPMALYLEFKGDRGVFSRWDGEQQKNVEYDEIRCVFMDSRSSITGWNDENKGRVYSNLVKFTKEEPFFVSVNRVKLCNGLYKDIKKEIEGVGGKFTTNLFVMAEIDGEWVPTVLQLHSTTLSNWSDYVEKNTMKKVYTQIVTIKRAKDQMKKGKIVWYPLDISGEDLPEEVGDLADRFCDEQLMPYLNQVVTTTESATV